MSDHDDRRNPRRHRVARRDGQRAGPRLGCDRDPGRGNHRRPQRTHPWARLRAGAAPRPRRVVATSDVVVSICPPAAAERVLADVVAAATRTGSAPLLLEANALAPDIVESLAARAAGAGLALVDGSVSGGPPSPGGDTMLYLSGAAGRRGRGTAGRRAPAPRRRQPRRSGVGGEDVHRLRLQGDDGSLGPGAPDGGGARCARRRPRRPRRGVPPAGRRRGPTHRDRDGQERPVRLRDGAHRPHAGPSRHLARALRGHGRRLPTPGLDPHSARSAPRRHMPSPTCAMSCPASPDA